MFSIPVTFTRPGFGVYAHSLAITTERCPIPKFVAITGEWVKQEYVAVPNPIAFPAVNLNASSSRVTTIQNNGGFDATISNVTMTPPGNFSIQTGYPTTIPVNGSVPIQINFSPKQEGPLAATACIIFNAPCADTLCIDLSGEGVRGSLVLTTPILDFGDRAQCESTMFRDTLRNEGSGQVRLLSAVITGPGLAAYTNLTPIPTPEILLPGATREFDIQFNPALAPADGPVNAVLAISTDDVIQGLVELPLEANRVTMLVDGGGPVAYGAVELALPAQRTVTLRNIGSTRLCYETDTRSAGITFTPALPLCIEPGLSANVTITLTPGATGSYNGRFVLFTQIPCIDSTVFQLSATVQDGSLTMTPSVDIGADASCLTRNLSVTISNSYLQSVSLDSLRLTGPDQTFFTIQTPSGFPQQISSSGSLVSTLTFTGAKLNRTYSAQLNAFFTTQAGTETKTSNLAAETIVSQVLIAPLVFPATIVGQAPQQLSTTVTNTSTTAITINSLSAGSPFSITGATPMPPVTLQAGESIQVDVLYTPLTGGTHSDSLVAVSSAPCTTTFGGALTGSATAKSIVDVVLSVGTFAGAPDDHMLIPILVDKDLGNSEVTSWTGSFSFNRTMLYPSRSVTTGTLSESMNVTMTYDHLTGTVHLTATGGQLTSGTGALVYVDCLVLVGSDVTTPITLLPDCAFLTGYANVASRSNGSFNLTGYCLVDKRLVRDISGTTLNQNNPNPVSRGSNAKTTISYSTTVDGFNEVLVFDMMGRPVSTLVQQQQPAGTYRVKLDATRLAAGMYYYMLRSGTFTTTRKLVVIE